MAKQWKAEKQFTLDCPICREPALPQQVESKDFGGKKGFALIHPGRIAPCFVRSDTDAAETIRTRFDEWFGTNDTSIATQTRTGRISDDSGFTEWSATYTGRVNSRQYEGIKNWVYASMAQIHDWENEGGFCPAYKD